MNSEKNLQLHDVNILNFILYADKYAFWLDFDAEGIPDNLHAISLNLGRRGCTSWGNDGVDIADPFAEEG